MTIDEIKELIKIDETRTLELKKTTGELKDGMHSVCAMLNSDGGYVIFGVAPKSLKLVGQQVTDNTRQEIAREIRKLEPCVNMPVEYIDVPDGNGNQLIVIHADIGIYKEAPYAFDGKPYYKLESTTMPMPQTMYEERLRRRSPEKYRWDAMITEDYTVDDMDEDIIRRVVRSGINNGRIHASAANDSTEQLLDRLELMKEGKLINAAMVLFAKKIRDYSQIELGMACFRGKTKNIFVDGKFAKGNFFYMLDAGITFLMNNLKIGGEVVGLLREERLELPIEALREALINALCHRQIERTLGNVTLAIFDDRVEISNPGCMPPELPIEKIKEPHKSYPRNKSIAQVLYQTAFLERWGTGVQRIIRICKDYGVSEPTWTATDFEVTVTFWRPSDTESSQNDTENCTKDCTIELTERQKLIIDIMRLSATITIPEIARKTSVSERTVKNEIKYLQDNGIIAREGSRKDGCWVVVCS